MNEKNFHKQSGLTLIELLAVIVISGLVLTLGWSILSNSYKYNDITQSKINLTQEANLIVSKLRKQHQNGDYKVCYGDEKLFFDSEKKLSIGSNGIKITSLENNWLLKDGVTDESLNISGSLNCVDFDNENPLIVKMTLMDQENNEFELNTVISNLTMSDSIVQSPNVSEGENPTLDSSFYDFLVKNNVFVYGSNINSTGGGDYLNGLGTMVINNGNNSDLNISQNTNFELKRIYINKGQNNVIFNSSVFLGKSNFTELVNIKGNLELNNGGAKVNGKDVYVDGNLTFKNSDKIYSENMAIINGNVKSSNDKSLIQSNELYIFGSYEGVGEVFADTIYIDGNVKLTKSGSIIKAKELYINGDVELIGRLEADKIFINGNVTLNQGYIEHRNGDSSVNIYGNVSINHSNDRIIANKVNIKGSITGEIKGKTHIIGEKKTNFNNMPQFPLQDSTLISIPPQPDYYEIQLHDENWYKDKGYIINTKNDNSSITISSNQKIYSSSSAKIENWSKLDNIVIVSKGDVSLTTGWDSSGVIIAPYGKVSFYGSSFTGLILSKNGFELQWGGKKVFFKNINEFFINREDIPFK